jgi:heme/copper-type cytochrome/quinol oxidase subunit 2
MHKFKSLFLVLLLVFTASKEVYAQCAMCKAVVENGDQSMAEGINSGITYLMAFPYILIGVLFYFLYKYRKRIKN